MIPIPILIRRRILQSADADSIDGIPDDASLFPPINGAVRPPFINTTAPLPFESSMALTILVLLAALFFLIFFSAYIRRLATAAENPPSPDSPDPHHRRPPSNSKGGLDASAVASLPIVAYGGAAKHTMIEDCPICLSEFHEGESVKLIPYCGHVFHPLCIDTWLASHVTCPLCRSAHLFKRVEEVCLDVTRDKDEISVGERSTVGDGEGSAGETGTCSCSNVLQRSTSL